MPAHNLYTTGEVIFSGIQAIKYCGEYSMDFGTQYSMGSVMKSWLSWHANSEFDTISGIKVIMMFWEGVQDLIYNLVRWCCDKVIMNFWEGVQDLIYNLVRWCRDKVIMKFWEGVQDLIYNLVRWCRVKVIMKFWEGVQDLMHNFHLI